MRVFKSVLQGLCLASAIMFIAHLATTVGWLAAAVTGGAALALGVVHYFITSDSKEPSRDTSRVSQGA